MIRLRLFAALLLSLVLATGSVTMALARAHSAGGTSMVICSGYGVVTLTLDANGNPTGPVHPCPECLAGLGLALLPALPQVQRPMMRVHLADVAVAVPRAGTVPPEPSARGPPTLA